VYFSPVELRSLNSKVVEAILGKNRTALLTLLTDDDAWVIRTKRAKEAKAVADAGPNAGFSPDHDPFLSVHVFSFTQPLELGGPLDPKKMSRLLYTTTIFYQDVPADMTTSSAFKDLQTEAKELMAELKVDIARVRVAGGSLSSTVTQSIHDSMMSFFNPAGERDGRDEQRPPRQLRLSDTGAHDLLVFPEAV
jgi:hypothetical protein